MAINNAFFPDYAVHPGEYLDELLECAHMEQTELAVRAGITPKHLSNIVNGKASVTAKTAIALEHVFPDRPARYWLGLQEAYDEFEARKASAEDIDLSDAQRWLDGFDIDALARAGYVPEAVMEGGVRERVSALLKFFGCASIEAWRKLYGGFAARARLRDERGSLSLAWMRKGQVDAAKQIQSLPRFDRRSFGRVLRASRGLANGSGADAARELQRRCADAGVLLAFAEPLPDMEARSATFWLANTPCIQLRNMSCVEDELWLDFAWETAKVMQGKTYLVSLSDDDWSEEPIEDSGCSWLVSWEQSSGFASQGDFSEDAVRRFSEVAGVRPGIVVGLLQRFGFVPWDSPLNKLKSRIEYAVVKMA